jgi:hypothetical protein
LAFGVIIRSAAKMSNGLSTVESRNDRHVFTAGHETGLPGNSRYDSMTAAKEFASPHVNGVKRRFFMRLITPPEFRARFGLRANSMGGGTMKRKDTGSRSGIPKALNFPFDANPIAILSLGAHANAA